MNTSLDIICTDLILDEQEHILLIKINRPKSLNALNRSVFSQLKELLEFVKTKPGIRCIIITGEGSKAFVAGADISEFSAIKANEAKSFLSLGNEVMNTIENYHIPIIAAINGFALGGGCELAMACHIRLASQNAKFGMPEINLGILPGYGGTQRLPKLVGSSKALEIMLTGDMINAEKALSIGLINSVFDEAELISKAKELASRLIQKAPFSVQSIIGAVSKSNGDLSKGIEYEGDLFNACANSEDFKEGVSAFFEKRKPVFKGL